jgi:hypothetical protein
MLHFTMSEDGRRASIDLCRGGTVRLAILRLCQELGCAIPAETLDEQADLGTLRALNLDLLLTRGERRIAQGRLLRAQEAEHRAAREQALPATIRYQVAALRTRARELRSSARYADDYGAYVEELTAADQLEREAEALIAYPPATTDRSVQETQPCPQP